MRNPDLAALAFGLLLGCSSAGSGAPRSSPDDAGEDAAAPGPDGGPSADGGWPMVDGGYVLGDGAVVRSDRFVTKLVDVSYGPCAGFGQGRLPGIIEGPPQGTGTTEGSTDVLSLGNGGSLVVSFEPNAIVDGMGPDFIIFENPFWTSGNPDHPYAEPGVVSVSDDGVTWKTFEHCTATNASEGPPYGASLYGACAGWSPVFSSADSGISPFDPAVAGGNAFDLHDVGLAQARYVKIVDQGGEPCGPDRITNGFDLDAIAIINAQVP